MRRGGDCLARLSMICDFRIGLIGDFGRHPFYVSVCVLGDTARIDGVGSCRLYLFLVLVRHFGKY